MWSSVRFRPCGLCRGGVTRTRPHLSVSAPVPVVPVSEGVRALTGPRAILRLHDYNSRRQQSEVISWRRPLSSSSSQGPDPTAFESRQSNSIRDGRRRGGDGENGGDDDADDRNSLIGKLNASIAANPLTSCFTFLGMRSGTWSALSAIFALQFPSGSLGPELAVGYLVVKVTTRFTQPISIAMTPLLVKAFPSLQLIKASALFAPPTPPTPAGESPPPFTVPSWLTDPINKYGFSYYLASKINVFCVLSGSAVAVKYGMDLPALLSSWGISTSLQDASGSMGLATLVNLVLLPGHMALLPYVSGAAANAMSPLSKAIEGKMQESEQVPKTKEGK
jgi:hypothetical protein